MGTSKNQFKWQTATAQLEKAYCFFFVEFFFLFVSH